MSSKKLLFEISFLLYGDERPLHVIILTPPYGMAGYATTMRNICMSGIGVIHNPYARENNRHPDIGIDLKRILSDHGIFRQTQSIEELDEAAKDFMDNEIEIVAINGGDGTLHRVLSSFVNVYAKNPLPKFLFLRGGTMNTVCNSIKIKGKVNAKFNRAIEKYIKKEPVREIKQPLIKANDKYGFMTGAGVVAKFLDAYYSGQTGAVAAAKMVSRLIFSSIFQTAYAREMFSTSQFRVKVNGKDLNSDAYMFVLGCTIKELGLGFTPTPRAYEKPNHFHFIAASMGPFELVPKVPALWLGKKITHPNMQYNAIAKEVVISSEEKLKWMMDGDIYETMDAINYSVGPEIIVIDP